MWIGGELSWLERLCLGSFAEKGYDVKLYSYSEIEVPNGVSLSDANEIIPSTEIFQNPPPSKSYAGFSNVFRYSLMAKKPDEVWIDSDVLATDQNFPNADYLFGYENETYINGAILRLPGDSALLDSLRINASRIDKSKFVWGDLGPKLITREAERLGLVSLAFPRNEFYEVSSVEVWKLFSPKHVDEMTTRVQHSSSIHVWNEALKLARVDIKSYLPNPKSFIGQLLGPPHESLQSLNTLPERHLNAWRYSSLTQAFRNQIANQFKGRLPKS